MSVINRTEISVNSERMLKLYVDWKSPTVVKTRGEAVNKNIYLKIFLLQYVDPKLSKKILEHARTQQLEEEGEDEGKVETVKITQLDERSDDSSAESEDDMDGDYIEDFVSD